MKKSILKEKLKNVIRPYVINEITMEPQKSVAKYQEPCELLEKIKKEVGDDAKVEFSPDSGKVVAECELNGKKYSIQISENGCDCYSLTVILDGSERACLKTAKFDDIQKLIKETIKNKERKKYTEKAYDKNAIPKKEDKKEKVEETDKCEEVKEFKKQADHKPVETKGRDIEEVTKGTSGMKDSTKFEKQVDIKGKDKVKLKADKKNSSKEKLTQKVDGTSKMKALKENIKDAIKEVLNEIAIKGEETPRKINDDPTKEEMIDFLKKSYGNEEGFEYDAEEAIYWFSNHYHGGQWSNLYSALSTSDFSPGAISRGPEKGSSAEMMYKDLEHEFAGKEYSDEDETNDELDDDDDQINTLREHIKNIVSEVLKKK